MSFLFNSDIEKIKNSLSEFLTKFENGIYKKLDDKTKGIIKPSLDKVNVELNKKGFDINLIKPILKEFRAGFGNPDVENEVPPEVKDLYLKYKKFLNNLDFDNLNTTQNVTKISSFLQDKNNFVLPPPPPLSNTVPIAMPIAQPIVPTPVTQAVGVVPVNATPSKEYKMDGITNSTIGSYYDAKTGMQQGINSFVGTGQQLSGNLRDGTKTKETGQAMEGLRSVSNMLGKTAPGVPPGASLGPPPGALPGLPGMPQGLPGMPQGSSGVLGALTERLIIKKIDETFLKIQEQICATFNDYKKQIGEALIKKMVEKIEEHSTAFKEYTKFRYDYEANKSSGKSPLNASNVFYQIYDNVRAQIQYKQVDFKKVDFSDQIFSKYEAWKKEYDKTQSNFLISGGGGASDILNAAQAVYDAMPLPESAKVRITEGMSRIMGTEMKNKKNKSKQNGANGDGANGDGAKDGDGEENDKDGDEKNKNGDGDKKNEKKKSENGKATTLDEAVVHSIEKLSIPFTNAQLDLIYEKIFFGLHNPSVLIVKLLCNISDDEREQLIKDLTIQNTRDKMKDYYNEYMANKPGWPQRAKTIWEKIVCNMNRHTDCPENPDSKASPLLEPLTGAVPGTILGGYEKYIRKVRKTRRKRIVKKGKRKNKTYHRHGSV